MPFSRVLIVLLIAQALIPLSGRSATLLYSNDVLGEVEPCGCRIDPMGGIVRRSGLLKELESEKKGPFLQLDAGNLLFETKDFPESLIEIRKLQAKALLTALEKMGLEATVPGEKDFALGIDAYLDLFKGSKIQVLAANLLRDGKPFLPSSTVIEKIDENGKPVRYGIIGLVGENIEYPPGLTVQSRIDALKREQKALKGKYDKLIVLSHAGMEPDLALAKKNKGIDLIIGANSQSFTQEAVVENKVPIVQSSYRNQYIGVIALEKLSQPETFQLIGLEERFEKNADPAMKKAVMELNKRIEREKKKTFGESGR